ncbi:MAG: BACON domain-containing protein [Alistipes sp.]|nr:BACON domain-containing protein [Alistipes sp.]
MKLRNLFYLLLALPLAFASCSEEPSSTDGGDVMDFTLELTSEATMTFEALGGEGTITYTYDNPSGVKPEAVGYANWISNVTVGDNTVTFTVAENEGEARSTIIKVVAFHKSFEVTINQNASEIEGDYCLLDANHALAVYYGDMYTPGYADNFYLYLSDKGFDEEYYELPNGTYYIFDMYAPIGDGTKIPAGTYTIDPNDSGEPWTASLSYSAYYILDDYAEEAIEFDYPASGTIFVGEDGSVTAEVAMLNTGIGHRVTYDGGNIEIFDMSEGEGGGDDYYSTLTGDVTCDFSDHGILAYQYGDWYEVGLQNWALLIYPNNYIGDYLQLDILAGANSVNDFIGTYTVSDNLSAFTAYPGEIDYEDMYGSVYYNSYDGETIGEYATLVNGWIEVVDNENGSITLNLDVWDDANHNITGSYTGSFNIVDSQTYSTTRGNTKKIENSLVIAEQSAPKRKANFRFVK